MANRELVSETYANKGFFLIVAWSMLGYFSIKFAGNINVIQSFSYSGGLYVVALWSAIGFIAATILCGIKYNKSKYKKLLSKTPNVFGAITLALIGSIMAQQPLLNTKSTLLAIEKKNPNHYILNRVQSHIENNQWAEVEKIGSLYAHKISPEMLESLSIIAELIPDSNLKEDMRREVDSGYVGSRLYTDLIGRIAKEKDADYFSGHSSNKQN